LKTKIISSKQYNQQNLSFNLHKNTKRMKFHSIKNILLLLPICLSFLACTKKVQDKTTETNMNKTAQQTTPPTPASTVPSKPVEVKVENELLVSLQRTPCFGQCPVFKIELFSDGKVVYEGKTFSKRVGSYRATATPEFIKAIQQKAADIKYLSLDTKYPKGESMITDIPTTISFVRTGSENKMIRNNYDAPPELLEFEHWLELQFENLKWEAKE
jgi:Domain of unknown function (DUF6438)